ncbi:hypothetical protein ciss_07530 [Carboxydothermus islandicus]|uniref:Uncharacterized protein n=1 Tax=Carboxydothermus islandicus TaxID=661089 RepID=A0A1L8D0W8_9THEO|nr:hypothetical protein ciss_07530 [Carboxydothermus islandicus]
MWTPIEIYQGQPGTAETTFATVPSGKQWVIKEIILCNTTTTDRTITIHVRRGGAAANVTCRIASSLTVKANETIYWPCSIVLNAGGVLSGFASAASAITVTISGEERVV